jgi:hypothetical protein
VAARRLDLALSFDDASARYLDLIVDHNYDPVEQ